MFGYNRAFDSTTYTALPFGREPWTYGSATRSHRPRSGVKTQRNLSANTYGVSSHE